MVVEDYVGIEAESFGLAAVGERVGDDFEVWGAGEYQETYDDVRGCIVEAIFVENVCTFGAICVKAELLKSAFPSGS